MTFKAICLSNDGFKIASLHKKELKIWSIPNFTLLKTYFEF